MTVVSDDSVSNFNFSATCEEEISGMEKCSINFLEQIPSDFTN